MKSPGVPGNCKEQVPSKWFINKEDFDTVQFVYTVSCDEKITNVHKLWFLVDVCAVALLFHWTPRTPSCQHPSAAQTQRCPALRPAHHWSQERTQTGQCGVLPLKLCEDTRCVHACLHIDLAHILYFLWSRSGKKTTNIQSAWYWMLNTAENRYITTCISSDHQQFN